jgi:hypothetical protein
MRCYLKNINYDICIHTERWWKVYCDIITLNGASKYMLTFDVTNLNTTNDATFYLNDHHIACANAEVF